MHPTGVYAAVFRGTGSTTPKTAMPLGTGTGAATTFIAGETISACEDTVNWTGTALSNDAVNYKEGTKSLLDTIPGGAGTYETKYTPAAALDFTHRRYFSLWLKCSRASTAYTSARVRLYDGANYNYYDITFTAATWKRLDIAVRAPNGNSGTAPNLNNITAVSIVLVVADATGWTLNMDWVSMNPQLCEVTAVYDNAAEVPKTDYSASPSGVVVFITAPTNGHNITANYNYYATITQVAGAHNWSKEGTAKLEDVTDYASGSWEEDIVANKNWTIKTERHWETGDLFEAGAVYLARFYVILDIATPVFYEGIVTCSRDSIAVPQATIVNESLDMKGKGQLFYVPDATI
jgi:hypothetical protein